MDDNEIIGALHVLCGFDGKSCSGNCAACPADQFRKQHPSGACDDGTMTAATALIESLQSQLAASQRRERAAVEDMERIANHKISMCAICKHNDVLWAGSGCNLQNSGEPCYFSYIGPQEAGKGE